VCGIAGFTHSHSPNVKARIGEAVATLIHRGPDQQGTYQSESVALGAARLKIVDLHTGDQPIVSQDGDAVIVFNGEIYNHRELRRELESFGSKFRSDTDTETVLEAFRKWDVDCFARLRGMFAIAIWIQSRRRLILARDRLGIKPLYVAKVGRDVLFGSEMKAIFVHPQVTRHLCREGLDCFLSMNYVPCPLTLVQGIRKLQPGHWLEWRDGITVTDRFWKLPFRPKARWTIESAKEQLEVLLRESVREHLVSDVPLGIWLSGGLDSSTILHYAADASRVPLRTFSITFEGREFDESAYIRRVVQAYGTRHEQLDLTSDLASPDLLEEFVHYSDDPNGDAGAVPAWYLSKLTRRHATVALSGEGADELFGGYLTHRADILAKRCRRAPGRLIRAASDIAGRITASDEKIGLEYKLKRFLRGVQYAAECSHVFWNGSFGDCEKQRLLKSSVQGGMKSILRELKAAGDDLKANLWFDQSYFLPDDILAKVDRVSMAHSLEVRPPFLDHRIVEFAASLPSSLLISGSRQKVILRELMKGKLHPSILSRKKIGLDIPVHQWLRGHLRALLMDTLASGLSAHSDLFVRSEIERCRDRHLGKSENLGYNLWGLMILFLWMRKWKIQTATTTAAAAVHGGALSPM
jgi:asparagine synthase (glutamine-hydrolysing)